MSRCCSVKRCARGRLARYSRNFSSGLCETSTLGSGVSSWPGGSVALVGCCAIRLSESIMLEAMEQTVEGGLPLLGRIVGAGGNLAPNTFDQFGTDRFTVGAAPAALAAFHASAFLGV